MLISKLLNLEVIDCLEKVKNYKQSDQNRGYPSSESADTVLLSVQTYTHLPFIITYFYYIVYLSKT